MQKRAAGAPDCNWGLDMTFIFTMLLTLILAGIVGYASERLGFTQNGYIPSIMVAIGGAFLFFILGFMFRFGFGSPGLNAVVASVGALLLLPTRYKPLPRNNNRPRGRRRR